MSTDISSSPASRTRPPTHLTTSVLRFAAPAVGLTWTVQVVFLLTGWPIFPALVAELVVLVTVAVRLTGRDEGRPGVRRLLAQALRWRFGWQWYAVALFAFPAATLGIAAVAGQLHGSASSYCSAAVGYLLSTVLVGAILGNVWEELAWTGYLQRLLSRRTTLLRAALITAIPFSLIHLPLAFAAHGLRGTSARDVAIDWTALIAVAPVFRYLLALVWSRTGGSVLAVALVHGSFNACASSSVVSGGWEYVVAAFVVTPVVALAAHRRRQAAPTARPGQPSSTPVPPPHHAEES